MSEDTGTGNAGWTIGSSMAMELDMALTATGGYFSMGALPEDLAGLVRAIPADWQAEWPELLGESGRLVSILEYASYVAGTLLDDDYRRVTLAIRDLTAEQALARVEHEAGAFGLRAQTDLVLPDRLVARWSDLLVAVHQAVGYKITPEHPVARRIKREVVRAVRVLRDGDLHTRFWHWLDRFFYQFYQPWRQTRVDGLSALERQATLALGARQQRGVPPEMAWLPAQNLLLRTPELQAAVQASGLDVFFWVEPFGLADTLALQPGLVVVSFAEPGVLYENFRAFAGDVAARTSALADPTRLIILRMIRHFDMVNTEIAEYLQLARPTVSVHAKILREAGLIRSSKEGRLVRHEIEPEAVRRLFRDLQRLLDLPPEQL